MRVRRPKFDFSQTPPHWACIPEFAQSMNATSTFIPHLERFLNRVLAMARPQIAGDDAESVALRRDIGIFVKQEANHYAIHADFNEILTRAGYDKIKAFEAEIAQEFEHMLATKSLKFLTAYCEGFETLGPPYAVVWLDEMSDLLDGANAEVVDLWKWHLTEEYEHRTVCHDVYHRLYGGYFYRLYGFFYHLRHLSGYANKVQAYLLEIDRAHMTPVQRAESIKRARRVSWQIIKRSVPRLLRAMSPFYTPRKSPEPKMFRSQLAIIESKLA